jgi:hypothetical protein
MRSNESKYSAVVSFNRNSLQVEVNIASSRQQQWPVRVHAGLTSCEFQKLL